MSTKTTLTISLILVAAVLATGLAVYARMPETVPSHWNAAGQVDGYTSRFWGVFLMPIIIVALLGLFLLIPQIDPLKANIAQFRGIFNWFIVAFTAYMTYIYALTLAAALGYSFNMTLMLIPAVGLLFIGVGYMISKAKRNFFIGIRTPWTLSSDKVWDGTHQIGSKMFMVAGVITILSAFLGEAGIWLMMAALFAAAIIPIVYSYVLYQRETKS